jgi:LysM repeat protein
MSKKVLRAIAMLLLIVAVAITLFITVVSAKEAGAVPDSAAADVLAQNNGSIRGVVFYDSNGNGVKDAGEAGMPGQTVTIYSSGKWSYAYTSGGDGTFGPAGLSPGYYSAQLTVPYGYRPTTATRYDGLGVGVEKTVVTGVNFGLTTSYYGAPYTGGPTAVRPPIYYPQAVTAPVYYPPVTTPSTCTYVVKAGDSLGYIAQRYGTTISALASTNQISNANLIYAGQLLHLPGCSANPPQPPAATTTVVVGYGDTLYSIAVRFGTTVGHLSALNGIANPDLIYAGQVLIVPAG